MDVALAQLTADNNKAKEYLIKSEALFALIAYPDLAGSAAAMFSDVFRSTILELYNDSLVYAGILPHIQSYVAENQQHTTGKATTFAAKSELFQSNALKVATSKNILYDLVLYRFYLAELEEAPVLDVAGKVVITAAFAHNPVYANLLFAENARMLAIRAKSKSIVKPTPDVPADKVLPAIISKYKGKRVMVDYWATWCGPCRVAMETIKPLKHEYEGADVVFIYITNPSSPMNKWQSMILGIEGDHYRLDNAQFGAIAKKHSIQGIPTYQVYDKNGKLTKQFTGYPGNDEVKKALEAAK
jgi:thiol-disulfide isomerase/thioredoxin